MEKSLAKNKSGFTIIEVMVSITLFLVIVMAGMAALLNVNLLSQKSRDMRSVTDNLNFTMDEISRNLRTGYSYHCMDAGYTTDTTPHSCLTGKGVSFLSSPSGTPVQYFIDGSNGISKTENGTTSPLTPSNISIDPASSFIVSGAESGDGLQPYVTIKLGGSITYNKVSSPFSLQTSVSQRLLDNK